MSGCMREAECEVGATPHPPLCLCVHAYMGTLFNFPSRNSYQRKMLMAHARIGYIICEAQRKMKIQIPCSKIIKYVKTAIAER